MLESRSTAVDADERGDRSVVVSRAAFKHWVDKYGILRGHFHKDGLCEEFREWWHAAEQ